MRAAWLALLAVLAWTTAAQADRRVALVVGNAQYSKINRLQNPANDAPDMAAALTKLGFEVITRIDADKGSLERALAQFARSATGADAALFYYAGHGVQYQRQNYLLPVDIEVEDYNDIEFQALSMSRVMDALNRSKGVKLLILDACRDNPLDSKLASGRGVGGGARGLAPIDASSVSDGGMLVAYATAPNQKALDGNGRNSPFTESMLHWIGVPSLEVQPMFLRVRNEVYQSTQQQQRPEVTNSLVSEFYFNPTESDRAAWEKIRDSLDPADFKAFVEKFPSSSLVINAQQRVDLFARLRREADDDRRRAEDERRRAEERDSRDALERERAALAAERLEFERRESQRRQAERVTNEQRERDRLQAQQDMTQRLEAEKQARAARDARSREAEQELAERRKKDLAAAEAQMLAERTAKEEELARRAAEREKLLTEEQQRRAALLREAEAQKREEAAEKQRQKLVCEREGADLKRLAESGTRAALDAFGTTVGCPAVVAALDAARRRIDMRDAKACEAELATVKRFAGDASGLQASADGLTCVRAKEAAGEQLAKLRAEATERDRACAAESESVAAAKGAQDPLAALSKLQKALTCQRLKPVVATGIKELSELAQRAKEADERRMRAEVQAQLARLHCYAGPLDGGSNAATKEGLSRFSKGGKLNEATVLELLKAAPDGFCDQKPPAGVAKTNPAVDEDEDDDAPVAKPRRGKKTAKAPVEKPSPRVVTRNGGRRAPRIVQEAPVHKPPARHAAPIIESRRRAPARAVVAPAPARAQPLAMTPAPAPAAPSRTPRMSVGF